MRNRLGWIAAAITLVVAVRLALPIALERWLERRVSREMGASVEIGELGLSLWSARLRLESLRFAAPRLLVPYRAVANVETISLQFRWAPLLDRRVELRELVIAKPALFLTETAPPAAGRPAAPRPTPKAASATRPRWSVAIDQFSLADARVEVARGEPTAQLALFSLDRIDLARLSWDGELLSVETIHLGGPDLQVQPALLPAADDPEPPPAEEPDASATNPLLISQLEFEGARVRWGEADFELAFRGHDISLAPGARWPLELELRSGPGSLTAGGELAIIPLIFDGTVEWSNVDLPQLLALAAAGSDWQSGVTDGSLHVALGTEQRPRARIRGTASVRDVAGAAETAGPSAWGVDQLEVSARELEIPLAADGGPVAIELETVRAIAPRLTWIRDATGGSAERRIRDYTFAIDRLDVSAGHLEFRDPAVEPEHRSVFRDLTVRGRDIRLPERSAVLRAEATVAPHGRVAFDAQVVGKRGAGSLRVSDLALVPFAGYAKPHGYFIQGGALDLNTEFDSSVDQVALENELLFSHLRVADPGYEFEKTFGLPLPLAMAMLRGPRGKIVLRVPATVRRGETEAALLATFGSAFRQALVGALSTPLKVVQVLIPRRAGGPEYEGAIAFDPGSVDLTRAGAQQLDRLAEFLIAYPGLRLSLSGRAQPTEAAAPGAVSAGPEEEPTARKPWWRRLWPERRQAGSDSDAAGVPPTTAGWRALADARANAATQRLVEELGVAPEQVSREAAREGSPAVALELRY